MGPWNILFAKNIQVGMFFGWWDTPIWENFHERGSEEVLLNSTKRVGGKLLEKRERVENKLPL